MSVDPGARGAGIAGFLLAVAAWLWMTQAHIDPIDEAQLGPKERLHAEVLANRAPDPYQYKLWIVTHALEAVHESTGISLEWVFYANTFLSLGLLVLCHHRWLRTYVGARGALLGTLALAALANSLFRIYHHHPYEFWGVALFCVLLRWCERERGWIALSLLALVTGLVWEKHALTPALWGLLRLSRGDRFLATLGRGLVFLAAALAVPVAVRLYLGGDRALVDGDTTLALQDWKKVAWFQLPFLVPFVALLLARFRAVALWVRLLWLYLPVLVAAYVSQQFILHEVRSFWALVPVMTATLCAWWSDARGVREGRGPVTASL
jgi:hypothetical protein